MPFLRLVISDECMNDGIFHHSLNYLTYKAFYNIIHFCHQATLRASAAPPTRPASPRSVNTSTSSAQVRKATSLSKVLCIPSKQVLDFF